MSSRTGSTCQVQSLLMQLLLLLLNVLLQPAVPRAAVVQPSIDDGRQGVIQVDLEKLSHYRALIRQVSRLSPVSSCPGGAGLRQLLCPERTRIFVRSAKDDVAGCGSNDSVHRAESSKGMRTCGMSRALQAAKLKCEEGSRCNLTQPMLQSKTDDPLKLAPCYRLLDRLKISYQCEPAIRSRLICADTYTTLSCGSFGKILTLDAVLTSRYLLPQLLDSADVEPDDARIRTGARQGPPGIQDALQRGRCPDTVRPESNAARCPDSQASAFGEVKRRCDGRHSCTVLADAQLLMADMPGCARPHLLMLFACLPDKKSADSAKQPQNQFPDLPPPPPPPPPRLPRPPLETDEDPVERRPPKVILPAGGGGESESLGSNDETSASRPPTSTPTAQSATPTDSNTGLVLLAAGAAAGAGALLIAGFVICGVCLAARRCQRQRQERADERRARAALSKQLPPPATCLPLMKHPPPPAMTSNTPRHNPQHQLQQHLLQQQQQQHQQHQQQQLDSQSSSAGSAATTVLTGSSSGGCGASSAGQSSASPRESVVTYSMHARQRDAASVLEVLTQELGRGLL